jgi:hypothetical protein
VTTVAFTVAELADRVPLPRGCGTGTRWVRRMLVSFEETGLLDAEWRIARPADREAFSWLRWSELRDEHGRPLSDEDQLQYLLLDCGRASQGREIMARAAA